MAKTNKLSGPEQVADFLNKTDHPLQDAMKALRALILNANKEITEHIKWNGPSFCFTGDDRITFNLHRKDCILLVFHRGAKVKDTKGKEPLFADATRLLEWLAGDRAVVKIYSLAEVEEKKTKLTKLVKQWIRETAE